MHTINWLELHPQQTEVDVLNEHLYETLPARKVRQLLAYITLQAYPWEGHTELIPFYHPTQTYRKGEWVALPVPDPQKIRPMVWQIARVIHVEQTENPIQGKFQALTLEYYGRHIHVVSDIPNAHFINLDFTAYSPEDLAWVAVWAADTFAKPLQIVLDKLVKAGQLRGQFVGEIFIPSHVAALEPKKLDRFFHTLSATRPWVGSDEMLSSIPELSEMAHEKALALLRASLFESSYKPLGNDRWTTPVLFEQLNREVPRGLPTPHIHSKLDIWTDQDVRDFEHLPQNEHLELKPDDGEQEGSELTQPITEEWRPPNHPLRLPTLNYLHITWAYFPIDKFPTAFHPQAKLLFIQVIDGERLPFLLDRDQGMLKALDIEKLRVKFLESDLPAGTYLWLEYQGGENYRIAPRPLAAEIWVPCKQAYIEFGELRIKHTKIPMRYEGDPSVFKAEIRFEDIEALFAEANRVNLSVRDTIIYSVQEICDSDPQNRAHRLDIFNVVFLKRMCSYNSVQVLLYTSPCFEQLGGGYFRYINQAGDKLESRVRAPRYKNLTQTVEKEKLSRLDKDLTFHSNFPVPDMPTGSFIPKPDAFPIDSPFPQSLSVSSGEDSAQTPEQKLVGDKQINEHMDITLSAFPDQVADVPILETMQSNNSTLPEPLSASGQPPDNSLQNLPPKISYPRRVWKNLSNWWRNFIRIFGERYD